MALAPRTVQNIPDCLRRLPMTVLHPASITPVPTNKPRLRIGEYSDRPNLRWLFPGIRSRPRRVAGNGEELYPTVTGAGAGCLCLHSGFGHCHTAPALSHFSTMYGPPHSGHFSGTGLPQATNLQSGYRLQP